MIFFYFSKNLGKLSDTSSHNFFYIYIQWKNQLAIDKENENVINRKLSFGKDFSNDFLT